MNNDKCAACENGQKMSYGTRLCDYGTAVVPVTSSRHEKGLCGPEARLYTPVKRYAEFDE